MVLKQALLCDRNLLLRILGKGLENPSPLAIELQDVGVKFPVNKITRFDCVHGSLVAKTHHRVGRCVMVRRVIPIDFAVS